VFGKLLALGEAEQDRLEAVVAEQGAAQDALTRRLLPYRSLVCRCVIVPAPFDGTWSLRTAPCEPATWGSPFPPRPEKAEVVG
jgi:hypothetical protein